MKRMTYRSFAVMAALAMVGPAMAACSSSSTGDAVQSQSTESDAAGGSQSSEAEAPSTNGDGEQGSTESEEADDFPAPVKLRFGIGTVTQTGATAPYATVPESADFWSDLGLDVEVLPFPGGGDVLQALDSGNIDIGFVTTGGLFAAVQAGADIISIADNMTTQFQLPQVPEDSPIQSLADVPGSTVGVASLGSGSVSLLKAMLAVEGEDPDSVEFVAIGTGADMIQFVSQKAVDVIMIWDAPHLQIEQAGYPLREIAPDKYRDMGFNQNLAVRSSDLADPVKAEAFARLAQGIAKGNIFCETNAEACIGMLWDAVPESKPIGVDDDVAMDDAKLVLNARLSNTQAIDDTFGKVLPQSIDTYNELFLASGEITAAIPADKLYTDQLLPKINDFDRQSVKDFAESY